MPTYQENVGQANVAPTNVEPQNTQAENANKEKFKPIVNEKGFIVAIKPKNENQNAISEQFSDFMEKHIIGKDFSKEAINSFLNSRNFYMGQEKPKEEIDKYLKGVLDRIEKGTFGVKKTSSSDEIAELKAEVAELRKEVNALKAKEKKKNFNKDQYLGDDSLSFKVVSDRLQEVKEEWKGKGYTKEDFNALWDLNRNKKYKSMEEVEVAIANLKETVAARKAQNNANSAEQAQATETAQPQVQAEPKPAPVAQTKYNGDDDTAMNALRAEAIEQQKPSARNVQRM